MKVYRLHEWISFTLLFNGSIQSTPKIVSWFDGRFWLIQCFLYIYTKRKNKEKRKYSPD